LKLFIFVFTCLIYSTAQAECIGYPKKSPTTIFLKNPIDADKIYYRNGNYYIYLSYEAVLSYLKNRNGDYSQKLSSLIVNDYFVYRSIDIYKYSLENFNEEFFSSASAHIVDDLIYALLKNGQVRPIRVFTNDANTLKLESIDIVDDFSSSTQICSMDGEVIFEKLNYMQ